MGGTTQINQCGNYANIISNTYEESRAGGIVGMQNDEGNTVTIDQCFNMGNITGGTSNSVRSYVGGICGKNGIILNCYNNGNVIAHAKTTNQEQTIDINKNIENLGLNNNHIEVNSDNYTIKITEILAYAGGIVGYSQSNVSNCYNIGSVSGGKKRTSLSNNTEIYSFASASLFGDQITTYNTRLTTKLDFDYNLYFSPINGNMTQETTNCYGVNSIIENNLGYSVHEYTLKDWDLINIPPSSDTNIIVDGYLVNKQNESYSDQDITAYNTNLENYTYTISSSHIKILVSNLTITVSYNSHLKWTEGILAWKEEKEQNINLQILSEAFLLNQNFFTISKNNIQTTTFAETLGSSVWTQNSLINNGYPIHKSLLWSY